MNSLIISNFLKFVKKNQQDIILLIGVILISFLSFAIGFITATQQEKQPLGFQTTEQASTTENFTHQEK
jgi:uncharacterized membrane protein